MKIQKYYCDCCRKEVKNENDLESITIFSSFKYMQDNPNPYDIIEICKDCNNKIEKAKDDKFNEIKKSSTI